MSTVDAIAKHVTESVAALVETVKERDRVIEGLLRGKANMLHDIAGHERSIERLMEENRGLANECTQRVLEVGALTHIIGFRDGTIRRQSEQVHAIASECVRWKAEADALTQELQDLKGKKQ